MAGTFFELEGKTLLICVGAMRCGTSWLYQYLSTLAGVAISPIKEIHYFNAKFPDNSLTDMDVLAMKRLAFFTEQKSKPVENLLTSPVFQASLDRVQMIYDDEAYFGHLARICQSDTAILCDITTAYAAIGQPGFFYMKNFVAKHGLRLKVLFIMRDPIERLWSQLLHMQSLNPPAGAARRWPEALQSAPIMARADYRATVEALDACIHEKDILYLFYEDLFAEETLRRLCNFVGADYWPGNLGERANARQLTDDLPSDARVAFCDALAPQYDFCKDRFGVSLPENWAL